MNTLVYKDKNVFIEKEETSLKRQNQGFKSHLLAVGQQSLS